MEETETGRLVIRRLKRDDGMIHYMVEATGLDDIEVLGCLQYADICVRRKVDQKLTEAESTAQQADLTPTTAAEELQSVSLRTVYQKLQKLSDAANSTDTAVSGPAIASLRALLTACGTRPDASATVAQLLDQLKQAIIATTTDDAKLDALASSISSTRGNEDGA